MHIIRVKLQNYRDIEELELAFPDRGVIIVQGPNDVGKSSLAEAIRLVLEFKASSNHRSIQAIQPVGQDIGSLVELEVKSGKYHFTITKTFNRGRRTSLSVHTPSSMSLTGDDAHNRLVEILNETLDFDLWAALRVEQGMGISQAELGDAAWLRKALDTAAGQTISEDSEEPLFERATGERSVFYTPTGQPTGEFRSVSHEGQRLAETVTALQAEAKQLQSDVERSESIDRELQNKTANLALLEKSAEERESDAAEIELLRQKLVGLEAQQVGTQTQLEAANMALQSRERDVRASEEARERVKDLSSQIEGATNLQGLDERLSQHESDLESAKQSQRTAEAKRSTYQEDYNHLRDEFELERLTERHERITGAKKDAAEAEQWLGSHQVSADLVAAVEQSHIELEVSRAAFQEASATLEIRALAPISVKVDGEQISLAVDDSAEYPITDPITVSVPNQLDITVTPGTSAEDLSRAVAEKRSQYEVSCQTAGASDLDEARSLLRSREDHESKLKHRDQIVQTALQDLSEAELEGWITRYRERVRSYSEERDSDLALPGGQEQAREQLESAEQELKRAAAVVDTTFAEFEEINNQVAALKAEEAAQKARKEAEEILAKRLESELDAAREDQSDAVLQGRAENLKDAFRDIGDKVTDAKTKLDDRNPDQVDLLVVNARAAAKGGADDLLDLRELRIELRGRLDAFGERGIGEALADAESKSAHTDDEFARMSRRARAADLLYQTLDTNRSSARAAYIGPLRAEIERKGKLIFNNSFGVDIDDDLVVINRTLDGKTVPYRDIGGGAKEQIALIARLAVGELVSDEGGVPLIFDDVLGYSDPEKLERISAVLAASGQNTQIIILTCQPERYQHIGSASIKRLP